jgi:hypothetical protein
MSGCPRVIDARSLHTQELASWLTRMYNQCRAECNLYMMVVASYISSSFDGTNRRPNGVSHHYSRLP